MENAACKRRIRQYRAHARSLRRGLVLRLGRLGQLLRLYATAPLEPRLGRADGGRFAAKRRALHAF